LASKILGEVLPQPVTWLYPATASANLEEDSESDRESEGDITGELIAEAIEDDENQDKLPTIKMS
jgi:hypothetical protein